ncbi:alpha/beta fold hydrolase [Kribbella deserti]|uniref:Alpha/beta fold hydrolase n=1 Tax=Kribbella deserti TaxID=1926257 RepID=A0ABV6QGH4_9ACTN
MTIFHQVQGTGPALLFVHAGVGDSRMWAAQRDDLAKDHQVVTLDLRGYGETPLPPGTKYSDADDVLAVLDALGLETVTAVAASYGANVALQAASHKPERFNRLVLFSPPLDGVDATDDLRAFAGQENALLEAGDIDGATELNVRTWLGPEAGEDARALVTEMQAHAFRVQIAAGDDIENADYEVQPERITVPVTVYDGAHDLEFFHDTTKFLAGALPNAELVTLPWAGHLAALERPDETTALIRAAL